MNADLQPPPNALLVQKTRAERALMLHDEEWQLHTDCIELARQALVHYKASGQKKLRIPDIARLLELASHLGRLATGSPTEHVEHAFAQFYDPVFIADLERRCDTAFAEPIEISSVAVATDQTLAIDNPLP